MKANRSVIVATVVLLAGCTAQVASPSEQAPSGADVPTTTSPTAPTASTTSAPSPSASIGADPSSAPDPIASPEYALIDASQSARVVVDGLAVRAGPGTDEPLVAGYRWDDATGTEVKDANAVRVGDGYFLWIEDGPLVINGVPWYRVANTLRQADAEPEELLRWDADGDEFRSDYAWVAGGNSENPFLVADDPPPPPPDTEVIGGVPDPIVVAHGIGTARTDAFELTDPAVGIRWYAAPSTGDSCTITITLQPVGVVMASAEIHAWGGGDEFWPHDGTQLPDGEHWVEVDTNCSWSLRVVWIIG